jgi:hypothetical protein
MLLFIDESGHDHGHAPYEVLAGVAIRERDLWNLIQAIRAAEVDYFGMHMSEVGLEFKGKKLLQTKNFRLSRQGPPINRNERRDLVREFLKKGWTEAQGGPAQSRTKAEFTAYGQAVTRFVLAVFKLMNNFRAKTFAALVNKDAAQPASQLLRRDYAFFFQRFFYYLEDIGTDEMGLIVFDELEKAKCKILLGQLEKYFLETEKGYQRSARIVPEPFFVHSDLTTAIQLADIVAYSLNWGLRLKTMKEATRNEMEPYGQHAFNLRYVGKRFDDFDQKEWATYGIFHLTDLRSKQERNSEEDPTE